MNPLSLLKTQIIRTYYKLFPSQYRIDKWKRDGKPAPPPREIKVKLLKSYAIKYKLTQFVETGTFQGDTTFDLRNYFKELISIELDENLYQKAVNRFSRCYKVKILHGDSGKVLEELNKKSIFNSTNTLFWLDGHYSEGITARGELVTPILKELLVISSSCLEYKMKHIIIIDDVHLFVGQDDYPNQEVLSQFVLDKFPNHRFFIENNCFILEPK